MKRSQTSLHQGPFIHRNTSLWTSIGTHISMPSSPLDIPHPRHSQMRLHGKKGFIIPIGRPLPVGNAPAKRSKQQSINPSLRGVRGFCAISVVCEDSTWVVPSRTVAVVQIPPFWYSFRSSLNLHRTDASVFFNEKSGANGCLRRIPRKATSPAREWKGWWRWEKGWWRWEMRTSLL